MDRVRENERAKRDLEGERRRERERNHLTRKVRGQSVCDCVQKSESRGVPTPPSRERERERPVTHSVSSRHTTTPPHTPVPRGSFRPRQARGLRVKELLADISAVVTAPGIQKDIIGGVYTTQGDIESLKKKELVSVCCLHSLNVLLYT